MNLAYLQIGQNHNTAQLFDQRSTPSVHFTAVGAM
jgi:hypothetical protein